MFSAFRTASPLTVRAFRTLPTTEAPAAVAMDKEAIRTRVIEEFAAMGVQVTVTDCTAPASQCDMLASAYDKLDLSNL